MTTIQVRVIPNAKKTAVAGRVGDAWKIRLNAPPVDGRANEVLIEFLSELFDCPKREITLISGAFSRTKKLRIPLALGDAESLLEKI
ncbi:DUF167 domain-containing protein [Patescibacteria group bacterium]|jgi:uncharacterized protein (TIGR00251 family)|nr:DUF167 domain-containing protein [Patescibacteria group bacterium]